MAKIIFFLIEENCRLIVVILHEMLLPSVMMSPLLIDDRDDFNLEDAEDNRASTAQFLAKKPTPLRLADWHLLQLGHTIRLIEAGETLYHVKFTVQHKAFWQTVPQITQIEVWRQWGSLTATHGLPKAVFFDYFLKHYAAIICDGLHTESGKRFWLDRLSEALEQQYPVFYGDYAMRELHKIDNRQQLIEQYKSSAWGDAAAHQDRRFAIGQKMPA